MLALKNGCRFDFLPNSYIKKREMKHTLQGIRCNSVADPAAVTRTDLHMPLIFSGRCRIWMMGSQKTDLTHTGKSFGGNRDFSFLPSCMLFKYTGSSFNYFRIFILFVGRYGKTHQQYHKT